MAGKVNISKSTQEYVKSYENMRGVSFTGDQTGSKNGRFSYLENMYVDYSGDGDAPESIPGFRTLYSFEKNINGVYLQSIGDGKEYVLVHAGDELYRFEKDERDSLEALTPIATLSDAKSCAFIYGRDVYILNGTNMYRVTDSGAVYTLGDDECMPYIPLLFKDSVPCEDRNLLTNKGREIYNVKQYDYFGYESPGLIYDKFDSDNKTCVVMGISDDFEGQLFIPSYTTLDSEYYRVIGIGPRAFISNEKITGLVCHEGLEFIDNKAFFDCTSIHDVRLPDSLIEIKDYAFYNNTDMFAFFLGLGLEKVGIAALGGIMQPQIWLQKDRSQLEGIENYEVLTQFADPYDSTAADSVKEFCTWPIVAVQFKIHYPIESVEYIKINGELQTRYSPEHKILRTPVYNENTGIISMIMMSRGYIDNSQIEFGVILKDAACVCEGAKSDIFSVPLSDCFVTGSGIFKCKCSAIFDGRIFLSGNPSLGGTVFYSAKTESGAVLPTYFGSRSFLLDGIGDYGVTSLMATEDGIAVLKGGDEGGGSIFYHTSGSKDEYPVSGVYGGTGSQGDSQLFFNDALFLCERGLCAIEKSSSYSNRLIKCRSGAVNAKLLREDISKASIAKWCGYLVLCTEGRMYLADSRDTYKTEDTTEYEWYYLNGIGTYKDALRVYRYSSVAREGYSVNENTDTPALSTVYSVADEDGELVYYTLENENKYEVYPTRQLSGGSFSPAVKAVGCGELLFFFTEDGDMCVFNNDKRSEPPDYIKAKDDFSDSEYAEAMGGKIHPDFYAFGDHAAHYELRCIKDDCSVPYLTKNTVRSSLVIKCKNITNGNLICNVTTDNGGSEECAKFPPAKMCFKAFDFSFVSFCCEDFSIVPISEGERGWIYKQITLYSDEFCAPIGVYSVNYRYKIKGKIRKS